MDTVLYDKIADLIEAARKRALTTVNLAMVHTYYEIGRIIVEDEQQGKERAGYGLYTIVELSKRLTDKFGKGFSARNIEQMRQFFLTYSIAQVPSAESHTTQRDNAQDINNSIPQTVSAELQRPDFQLSWSHYLKLMRIENANERRFYEIECIHNNWSLKELQRQFDSGLYERLAMSRDKAQVRQLAEKGQRIEQAKDLIKDPYVLEFLGLSDNALYSESELETKIIDQLQHFLLELGKGFAFVGRQVRFTFDEKHFRIDLVFYNRFLRCFVLLDLKLGEVMHQDLGQMQMYVNYYDRYIKTNDENPSIGIILCKEKNDTLVEITLPKDNNQIFASKYQTFLPSKEQLRALLNAEESN